MDGETRAMVLPAVRDDGPPRLHYGCVRAGPHRPFRAGPGTNASTFYVLYEARQARSRAGVPHSGVRARAAGLRRKRAACEGRRVGR